MSETESVVVHNGPSHFAVYEVMTKLMSLRMAEGSSAQQHAMTLTNLMNELEKLGGSINNKVKMGIVLKSLPKSYKLFVYLFKSEKDIKFEELLFGITAFERCIRGTPWADLSTNSFEGPSVPAKCEKKENNDGVNNGNKLGGPTGGIKKPKGKCFKCKKSGHRKADCPMKKS